MKLININKLLIFFISFVLFSCSKISFINDEKNITKQSIKEEIEKEDFIQVSQNDNIQLNDFYHKNDSFNWQNSKKLNKIYHLSLIKKIKKSSNSFHFIVSNNFVYFVNNETKFVKFNLSNGNKVFEIELENKINPKLILPISIAEIDNYFYIGFGNGKIIKIDENGKIYWERTFNTLLRTPIKIHNNNIIVLLNSNKILLLNSINGNTMWDYSFKLNKPSLSKGGKILSKNNVIFFIMPNGRIGAIESIIGEQIEYDFLSKLSQKNILNYNYEAKIHIYNNLFSIIENNNNLYTYDLKNNIFLLFEEKIYGVKSLIFNNNILLTLDNNNFLKSYNLINRNYFWNIDISKLLSKNEKIIKSFINEDSIIIFFSNGQILQINKINGEIIFNQSLKLNNVNYISYYNNYFIFNQTDGKILFYKQ